MDNLKKTKKKKLIIVSSESSSSGKNLTKKRKYIKSGKYSKKRKLNIESKSSSLLSSTKFSKKIDKNSLEKIDLKINPENINMNMNNKEKEKGTVFNGVFSDIMGQLYEIMMKQGEPFRAKAYQKAQETIMSYKDNIYSPDQLKGLPNIGPTIMEKLNEYVRTGTLQVLEREKNNPINILADVYGVGPKKAKELVEAGITSITQLRSKADMFLNETQKVGLKYYEDILQRIPRSEIDEYNTIFKKIFKSESKKNANDSKDEESVYEIVGSYRRGAQSSGDIDVIITSKNDAIFKDFIDNLIKKGIILEVLSRGVSKCLVIAKIPGSSFARRVDFLYTTPEEYPFSVLYFTGSKVFNTVMRHQALTMELTMNEHGMYSISGKKKGEKVAHSFKNEKDIFDYLNLVYKAPIDRVDGRDVLIKGPDNELKLEEVEKVFNKEKKEKKEKKVVLKSEKKKLIIEDEDDDEEIIVQIVDPFVKDLVNDFKKNGIRVLHNLNEQQLTHILSQVNILYRNMQPIMTDNEYDIIQDYIADKYPHNKTIWDIGAPVERGKATLPYQMWSMDKIKPDSNAVVNWSAKYSGPYVLSCKLDGVSGLYTSEGSVPKLYTRGDGKVGQDISHLIPYLKLPKTKGTVIRGEFIIPKAIFEAKYKGTFANPRNLVSGIINHKHIDEKIKDVDFVAYEVIKPVLKPSDQMAYLRVSNVKVVLNSSNTEISNEMLSSILVDWRTNYDYEIDGVIVCDDKIYDRKTGNPDHAFAFKMVLSEQIAEAKVVDVIWSPSKDGYLKPRVQIEPLILGGVRIEYATGFNGSFIMDNKVGVGAVIELIRSGDVIPHIRKVTMPAETAKMPDIAYKWNDTGVDILLEDIDNDETVKEKNITGFFRGIEVEGLSSGNVTRIISAGYDSVAKIINMYVDNFLEVEGFKMKMASKIYNGIREKLDSASIITLMSASNVFGRGFSGKKIELVFSLYPDVLTSKENREVKIAKIAAMKGMAQKTAEAFVDRIAAFVDFMKECGLEKKILISEDSVLVSKASMDTSNPLYEKTIVMTGFRDKDLEAGLKEVGAKMGSSVSKNTFCVVVKDLNLEESSKVLEAKRIGVPVLTLSQFNTQYGV
uniref:DNA polymerase beta n=1 Tax=viral metagenome TaxID=1070528 RepID=A0A6C0IH61_9ZZZZ